MLQELEQELSALETKDTELTVEVRVLRATVLGRRASLKAAEEQYAAATTSREDVRKQKQELQDIIKEFKGVAQRAADLLKKKRSD